jgi:hypothetical protein
VVPLALFHANKSGAPGIPPGTGSSQLLKAMTLASAEIRGEFDGCASSPPLELRVIRANTPVCRSNRNTSSTSFLSFATKLLACVANAMKRVIPV